MGKIFKELSVKDMVKGWLHLQKCVGLKNEKLKCSCSIDDLMNCGYDPSNCIPDRGIDQDEDKKILQFKKRQK